jgi:hypothetical protein
MASERVWIPWGNPHIFLLLIHAISIKMASERELVSMRKSSFFNEGIHAMSIDMPCETTQK